MNISSVKRSAGLVLLSIFTVYVISFLAFGVDGLAVLAVLHIAPFFSLLERSLDHPIDIWFITIYILSLGAAISLLVAVDQLIFFNRIQSVLVRGVLIAALYLVEVAALFGLLRVI
jgi:hypothetical protein